MSDVSAQAYREAAKITANLQDARLLLAAAEQREQWDKCRDGNVTLGRIMDIQHEQITTLTADRDELKHERDKHAHTITTTMREAIAEYNRDCERLEKRAEKAEAERDQAREHLTDGLLERDQLLIQIHLLTAERDEALGRIANART